VSPLRVVVMGVSGCGKTTVAMALAERLGARFIEGDRLHPEANVAKMAAGIPLMDADRWPWLNAVAGALASDAPAVASCSALKRAYRDRLRVVSGTPLHFLHLAGDRAILARRMAERPGHYMPVSLLDSQLATLEPPGPDEALTLPMNMPINRLVQTAIAAFTKGSS
jgi:gluconokinase